MNNEFIREGEAPARADRRSLMSRVGVGATAAAVIATMGPVGAALGSGAAHAQSALTDVDVLNFALNLEYLEAEFYSRGATGQGLPASLTGGTGLGGGVNGGGRVPFASPFFFEVAAKIAVDKLAHVNFLRNQLGSAAISRPLIDLAGGFQAVALSSGAIPAGAIFDPFADEISFFLGAFILTEVGVSAYIGAAAAISNPGVLTAAAAILSTRAYHAGAIRGLLTQASANINIPAADVAKAALLPFQTQAIANGHSTLSQAVTGTGITYVQNQSARLTNTDGNSLSYRRSPSQVMNIVYGGPSRQNGNFFPNGLNGKIS